MKKYFFLVLIFIASNSFAQKKQHPTKNLQLKTLVNPFIGTGGHGHTFPGPTMPFGACQLSPDTRLEGWDGCSGYHYSDSVIYGFSHTHLSGTGCSDYGDILLMPVTKEMQLDSYQYASKFSHKNEKAHAGYYQVYLDDPKINIELTTTLHGGIHQYTYEKNAEQYVVLDLKHRDEVLDSKMEQVDDYTIRGYRFSKAWASNQKLFYEIKFSKKIENIIYEPVKKGSNTTAINLQKSLHCLIKFQATDYSDFTDKKKLTTHNFQLTAFVSISGVDEEGAHKNLLAEMPNDSWNFDFYKNKCEQEWEKELSKIRISEFENLKISKLNQKNPPLEGREVIFYTALYHCMIHPSLYNDVDGRYRGRDDKIHNTDGKFNYYTVFSLWDTYRALHPLLTIIDKKRTNDFINTFIKQYEQCGRLPIWELSSNETNCMIGYHVVSVIWDAYNKGIRDYDVNKAFEAMKRIATDYTDYTDSVGSQQLAVGNKPKDLQFTTYNLQLKKEARERCADADALESYNRFGYVRSDNSHESVSKTLEYAYDDWCIAQMANTLGKKKDFDYYTNRSHNWMNVYDPTTGFMRARKNGTLYEPFSPYTVDNNYTEANSWQYSFYVPHEIEKLVYLQGGKEKFEQKLDDLFSAKTKTEGREQSDITGLIGQYAHGNEPSHQIAYLYNYIGKPQKAQKIINSIIDSFYTNQPDGLIGNEDCGQMSAWYVMNCLGFYSDCPGKIEYCLFNEIQFKKRKLDTLSFDNIITGLAISNKGEKIGSTIQFHQLQDCQLKDYFRNNKLNISTTPFIIGAKRIFKDSIKLKFLTPEDIGDNIYLSKDSMKTWRLIENSSTVISNIELFFYNQKNFFAGSIYCGKSESKSILEEINYPKSPIQTATFTKLPSDRKIYLGNEYNKSYHAGGADGLMDGIYGKLNWRAGDWQGYQGLDIEVVMAFDKPKEIKTIAANFLEDQNAWIFYPKEVSFYVSNDSINWTLVETIPTNKSDHNLDVTISKFTATDFSDNTDENTKNQINNSKIPTTDNRQLSTKFIKLKAKSFGKMPEWHEGRGFDTFIFIDEFVVE